MFKNETIFCLMNRTSLFYHCVLSRCGWPRGGGGCEPVPDALAVTPTVGQQVSVGVDLSGAPGYISKYKFKGGIPYGCVTCVCVCACLSNFFSLRTFRIFLF